MSAPSPSSPLAPDPLPPNPLAQYPPGRELPPLRDTQAGNHIGSEFVDGSHRATTLQPMLCYSENI